MLPICSSGNFLVYQYPPNYYAVYIRHFEYCGSGGCSIYLYKKEKEKYLQIDDIWGDLQLEECKNNDLIIGKTIKLDFCWYNASRKVIVINDSFSAKHTLEHVIINEEAHEENFLDRLSDYYKD